MLYPILIRLSQFLSESPCTNSKEITETKISSEFPKNLFVSILLILFMIVLLSLFIQLSILIVGAVFQGEVPFTQESLPYLGAYCLVNFLFLAHLCLYFGYKEEIVIDQEMIQIQSGYFSFKHNIILYKDQLMFSSIKENFIGNQHLKLYYCSPNHPNHKSLVNEADMDSIVLGTYLVEEQIETISRLINRLSF